ncbi:ABC transporter ATP-binding protein [Erysipelotrichaceae bacterium OttesenSCG-928-M19]|nr:ABC transporter ATP-binding protein [Erysipelotrichaceae bacterium OttesenSCG-928-M19]
MVIEVKDLVKRYGDLIALNHFNLTVKEGEILGLLGPNGSGKTTAINCMLSLLKYNKGTIKIFGENMKPTAYDIKEKIGVVMQDVAVMNDLTVYENIDYFCGLYISDKKLRHQYVIEAMNFVSIEEYAKFTPKKLSGGLLRRLNIACGIAHKPSLIFFDEPTVAVDPQSRNNILEGIKKLNEQGATIIYTSHYMEEVEQLCDRIIILDNGKIIAQGTKDELKAMIATSEKITFEIFDINKEIIDKIKLLDNVIDVNCNDIFLVIRFQKAEHNLTTIIDFLKQEQIDFEKIFSEQPTLNDVFLEITGKELRD